MAKLVDALPSGGSVRKDVLVRIQFWAPKQLKGDPLLDRLFNFRVKMKTIQWEGSFNSDGIWVWYKFALTELEK
jgi:hypothetical protein